jgi:NDP-sugar pyrophosphorylase family protein
MIVLFLCAGIGKRMFPITEDKFLLNFLGKTLLEHQLDMAIGSGLRRFVIVANHINIARIETITGRYPGKEFNFVVQEKPLGIANALQISGNLIKDELLIINPNDVFENTVYSALLAARKK